MRNVTFDDLGISEEKEEQFERAGIDSPEELLTIFPTKYINATRISGLFSQQEKPVFIMHVKKIRMIEGKRTFIRADGYDEQTGTQVNVTWFNQNYLFSSLQTNFTDRLALVCGAVYPPQDPRFPSYSVSNPTIFELYRTDKLRYYPVYKKVPGMSADYYNFALRETFEEKGKIPDVIPREIVEGKGLLTRHNMILSFHYPMNETMLAAAYKRKRWDDLLYFACRIALNRSKFPQKSSYSINEHPIMDKILSNLPYELTADQEAAVNGALKHIKRKKRLNMLLQGDVGSGKTIVAVLLMIAFAEQGYQTALMAPTQLLAKQHYNYLKELLSDCGLTVAFVSGKKLKVKEKKQLQDDIKSGKAQIIVGTQALLSKDYVFSNLAFVVEDEEHKYGVLQRGQLIEKASSGVHILTMSATPIPRTLAQVLYGNSLQLYSIKTKPAGRKPVITGIANDFARITSFMSHEIKEKNHQIYVVCPLISDSSSEKLEKVESAESVFKKYSDALSPKGITIALLTGKTKKTEAEAILEKFEKGELDILVSTTVIEVGINVPNATGMIIQNAERFGLAQLHQLRGRVGRGKSQGVCVLVSEDSRNPRLAAMCKTNDGFEIAQMDLEQRGSGNILGTEQSGEEEYLALALAYPQEYAEAQEAAAYLLRKHRECPLCQKAINDFLAAEI